MLIITERARSSQRSAGLLEGEVERPSCLGPFGFSGSNKSGLEVGEKIEGCWIDGWCLREHFCWTVYQSEGMWY